MSHYFISYSHKDKDYVHKLADALHAEDFEVWIDDRIDYGSRWTQVVENAIDACQALILVASEDAHQSEWVQHELARAQRLKKHIFPLLVSGDPWLGFESTQYFDVRSGILPNDKFYAALRSHEVQRFQYFRELVADSWPVYKNDDYGFSVQYPRQGDMLVWPNGFVQIDLPRFDGTNLDERRLLIHFRNDGNLPNPQIYGVMPGYKSHYVEILGLRFLKEIGDEGGMSRFHEFVSYSISRGSRVVTLQFHLATYASGVFGANPETIVEIDREAAKEILSYVVSTFTWLS